MAAEASVVLVAAVVAVAVAARHLRGQRLLRARALLLGQRRRRARRRPVLLVSLLRRRQRRRARAHLPLCLRLSVTRRLRRRFGLTSLGRLPLGALERRARRVARRL